MKKDKIFSLGMIAVVVSFLGFVVENIWLAITKGYMNNRSMVFPFLFGYGLAIVLIYLIFGEPRKMRFLAKPLHIKNKSVQILLYFFAIMICICLGELILGNAVEYICGFRWWNYSKIPLHITQYTSIPTSAGFSLIITLFMNRFFRPMFDTFAKNNKKVVRIIGVVLIAIMTLDFLYSGCLMYRKRKTILRWKINL